MINNERVGCAKDPITDPGKKSKEGLITLTRDRLTGELSTVKQADFFDSEVLARTLEDVMVTVYDHGTLMNETTTLTQIRARTGF